MLCRQSVGFHNEFMTIAAKVSPFYLVTPKLGVPLSINKSGTRQMVHYTEFWPCTLLSVHTLFRSGHKNPSLNGIEAQKTIQNNNRYQALFIYLVSGIASGTELSLFSTIAELVLKIYQSFTII